MYKIVEETRGKKKKKKERNNDANDEIFYSGKILNFPCKFYIIPNIWFLFYSNVPVYLFLERLIIYGTRKYNRGIRYNYYKHFDD